MAQAFAGPPGGEAGGRAAGWPGDRTAGRQRVRLYGDRLSAWREMLDGGELDVLTATTWPS
ncbi:hypothetical protein Nm8I071_08110 [Nonomuraea sp. TT08I-71]|nr:hypothetical protein Nm8I071_08110 [Nonomuraea sp. TT08I-71]